MISIKCHVTIDQVFTLNGKKNPDLILVHSFKYQHPNSDPPYVINPNSHAKLKKGLKSARFPFIMFSQPPSWTGKQPVKL